MRVAKGLEYENKITATSIKTSFSAYYEILPRIGNNENPNSKKNILENLKKEFKSYLNNLYPSGYDKTYEYDPFYLINDRSTDIKDFCKENNIYFWKIFENDDNLERYYQVLKEKRPANTYNSYMSSTNRLKDFFNQKYGGYINWLRTLSKTDNQEINFELIEDWAINYLGKYHSAGNSDSGTKGPKVIEEFKKLGNAVVSKFSDYTLSYCTSWQNSGKIYPYLWIQFKHKNWQDSPCSISMFVIKENGKTKLCIETEIDDKNAKSKDYENFLKTLNATFAYDNQYYWDPDVSSWIQIGNGDASSYKLIQNAVAAIPDSAVTTSNTRFVSNITQDTNGNIEFVREAINTSGTWTGTAAKVANNFKIQFDTGTTENTDTYSFNGSATKTINIKAGSNISLTKAANNITINSSYVDTKNTTGSTNTTSKIYLIGATSQASNPITYSNSKIYGTNGQLNATSVRIAEKVKLEYDSTNECLNFVFE